jgi:hypothetical protein
VTIAQNAPLNEAGCAHSITTSEKKKVISLRRGLDGADRVEKICENNLTAHVIFWMPPKLFVGPIAQDRTVMRRCGGPLRRRQGQAGSRQRALSGVA